MPVVDVVKTLKFMQENAHTIETIDREFEAFLEKRERIGRMDFVFRQNSMQVFMNLKMPYYEGVKRIQ